MSAFVLIAACGAFWCQGAPSRRFNNETFADHAACERRREQINNNLAVATVAISVVCKRH